MSRVCRTGRLQTTAATCCDWDDFIKAMADETRQEILRLLGQREMCVSELETLLTVHQPTVSHHLAVLRRANLVTARREGRRVYYQANAECVMACCGEILNRFRTGQGERDKEVLDHE
jgi:ArsR family transcriptional regulator